MTKTKFKSILAYLPDDAAQPLEDAALLAEKTRARLKIMDVLAPSDLRVIRSASSNLAHLIRSAKQDRLDKFAKHIQTSGITVTTELAEGEVETVIVREVFQNGHPLLVTGSGDARSRRLATPVMRLLRFCPCPVWVSGPQSVGTPLKMVAAVDVPTGDQARLNLSSKVLRLAASLASQLGAELHVLNAWQAYGESMLRSSRFANLRGEVASYVRQAKLDQAGELASLLKQARISLPEDRVHLIKGRAGDILPRFCRREKIGLLVLGTIARTGLGGALIGNTAEAVAGNTGCAILAVKPDGFVSPIHPE